MNEQNSQDLHVDIKQPVGGDYESGPIEVYRPEGYRGPLNYEAFRNAVERYYRSLVGSTGSGIRISGGKNIRMRNNVFEMPGTAEFEVSQTDTGW